MTGYESRVVESELDLPLMMSLPRACKLIGLGENLARRLALANEFPARRVGRRWLVSRVALLRWLEGEGR